MGVKYACYTQNNEKTRDLFLQLPQRLYGRTSPQDIKTERQILLGTHPLSRDFQVYPFVVMRNGRPVCRSILTSYDGDENGYVGFFEAEEDVESVCYMFDLICDQAKKLHKSALAGPLDASIFIKYRFKLDHFDSTYTGEPVNLPYYPALWVHCGFRMQEGYVSNQLRKVTADDVDLRYERIYERYVQKGCQFISPTKRTFDRIFKDVYGLLMELYRDFPGYQRINESQFEALFSSLKGVLNYEMVRVVYQDDRLRAFCICIPNYGGLTLGRMSLMKLARLLQIKRKPSEYVVMYMGASRATPGLGCALIQDIRNHLYQNQCTAIGALIHTGKLTERMYQNLYVDQRHYGLYCRSLEQ